MFLWLDKKDYPKNEHDVFCPDKQHSFEKIFYDKI